MSLDENVDGITRKVSNRGAPMKLSVQTPVSMSQELRFDSNVSRKTRFRVSLQTSKLKSKKLGFGRDFRRS